LASAKAEAVPEGTPDRPARARVLGKRWWNSLRFVRVVARARLRGDVDTRYEAAGQSSSLTEPELGTLAVVESRGAPAAIDTGGRVDAAAHPASSSPGATDATYGFVPGHEDTLEVPAFPDPARRHGVRRPATAGPRPQFSTPTVAPPAPYPLRFGPASFGFIVLIVLLGLVGFRVLAAGRSDEPELEVLNQRMYPHEEAVVAPGIDTASTIVYPWGVEPSVPP
jgi:hypothetical protein